MKRPYELIEHTADIIVKAYGESVEEAFAATAEAMFQLIVDESTIAATESIEFNLEAIDRESLLVQFLSELIAIHDIDGLVFGRVEVSFPSPTSLLCVAWGERFNEQKHERGLMVKAVSYHLLQIEEATEQEQAWVKVLFDI